jgi:hypothetical protein
MDVTYHPEAYVTITVGSEENEQFAVDLEGWQRINQSVIKMLKQK